MKYWLIYIYLYKELTLYIYISRYENYEDLTLWEVRKIKSWRYNIYRHEKLTLWIFNVKNNCTFNTITFILVKENSNWLEFHALMNIDFMPIMPVSEVTNYIEDCKANWHKPKSKYIDIMIFYFPVFSITSFNCHFWYLKIYIWY